VYVSGPAESQLTWMLVRWLDEAMIRAVGDLREADQPGGCARRIMAECAGVACVLAGEPGAADESVVADLRHAAGLGVPVLVFVAKTVPHRLDECDGRVRLRVGDRDLVLIEPGRLHGPVGYVADAPEPDSWAAIAASFAADVVGDAARIPPYAFLVGRLEKDFAQARAAIRAAVEREAGLPCLWSDDERHATNVASVREATRLVIEHARFVVADLTLGVENPEHENPSRAHEIGMAIAYDRPVMLCSQEPRRYPYFSVADMQMRFWATEAELADCVGDWIRVHRTDVARQVLNHRLGDIYPGYQPRLRRPEFRLDPARRYVGPATPGPGSARARTVLLLGAAVLVAALAVIVLVGLLVAKGG
jgi:hypothetical protein